MFFSLINMQKAMYRFVYTYIYIYTYIFLYAIKLNSFFTTNICKILQRSLKIKILIFNRTNEIIINE